MKNILKKFIYQIVENVLQGKKTVYFINLSLIHEDFKNNNYGVNLVLTGINS